MSQPRDIVLAFTGASGALYGVRLLEVLLHADRRVHVVASHAATRVFIAELGYEPDLQSGSLEDFLPTHGPRAQRLNELRPLDRPCALASGDFAGQFLHHSLLDFNAGIASGSFRTAGMVICPCSMGTLAAVAQGLSTNLIQRAADVHLKERRRLILVPRETPLGLVQLDNMRRLAEAGGIVLPAMPGFYHGPRGIIDLVDFVVARICDHLGVDVPLMRRWGEPGEPGE
ncbi:MAG: UbiX family flavin prenyltransferase [Planctomyces sp.]|nr:UbiX family flavin prenyltransferase [Planctomyces sp.]